MKASITALRSLQAKMSRALKTRVREDDGLLTAEVFRAGRDRVPYMITIACFAPIWDLDRPSGLRRGNVIIQVQLCVNGTVFYVSDTPHERDAVELCVVLRNIVREVAREVRKIQ